MGTWGELLNDLKALAQKGVENPQDVVRGNALSELHDCTGRNTILYAAGHLQKPQIGQNFVSIADEDVEGFMETIYGLDGDELDLILHSPGGTPNAANSIVEYLRSKFTDLRVIVPQMAMSAATMLACAADEIVMGRHSQLGPIDPQMVIQTELGVRMVPAEAILQQFEMAKEQCDDETTLAVWYPILRQYGPDLLIQCEHASDHAQDLVADWLGRYMFADRDNPAEQAEEAAKALAAREEHLSHGRPLRRDYLQDELGFEIDDLETPQEFQDRVLTVYHAFNLTFASTNATKLIENHEGRSFVKQVSAAAQQQPSPEEGPDGAEAGAAMPVEPHEPGEYT